MSRFIITKCCRSKVYECDTNAGGTTKPQGLKIILYNNWIINLIFYYMILDIEFETPCGSIIKVDLRVKNDGAKVTIQDAEIVSVGNIIFIF